VISGVDPPGVDRRDLRFDEVYRELGIDPEQVKGEVIISERHGHRIWRMRLGNRSFVVKCFADEISATAETAAYRILRQLGIRTLPVYGMSERALVLEDLSVSPRWRLACEEDIDRPKIGAALAAWYRLFHRRGSEFLGTSRPEPLVFRRESEALTAETMHETARALGLAGDPVWKTAIGALELLKAAESKLSTTFNYNDFHWTNLAVSRGESEQLQVTVFDFHLIGIGMRYSDCRNVISSLGPRAADAFRAEYGPVDPREVIIDRPLSALHSLSVAVRLPRFPTWAHCELEFVKSAALLRSLEEAMDVAKTLV